MASPQPDKYTKISNELMEVLPTYKLNGTQFAILLVVLRYTYGFQRKSHEFSLSFLASATNIHKHQIQRELNLLIKSNVLLEKTSPNFRVTREIIFNKNYETWTIKRREKSKQTTKTFTGSEKDNQTVSGLVVETVSELANQERKKKENTKERANLENNKSVSLRKDDVSKSSITSKPKNKDIDLFFEEMWKLYPRKLGKGRISDKKKKELYLLGDKFKQAIIKYTNQCKLKQTEEQYIKHGSSFFNTDYIDYLEDEQKISKKNRVLKWEETNPFVVDEAKMKHV